MTIFDKLKELGYSTVDPSFYDKIKIWRSWYAGNVKGFHDYKVRTGKSSINCKRYSLGMGKKVSEEWAGLLLNERVKITLEGEKEQKFVDDVLTRNNFQVVGNEMQEMKFALGTVAYVPRVVGMKEGKAEAILLDYVTAEHIYPLSWQNGMIQECAFDSILSVDGKDYAYLLIHKKGEDGTYDIESRIFRYNNGELSEETLKNVKGFENIPPVVHTKSKFPQFVIDRPNIANNVDYRVPLGISVFANAIDALESCDVAFDALTMDFVTGKRRLFASLAVTTYIDGEPAIDKNDVAFYLLPEDTTGENKPIQSTGGDFAVDVLREGVQTTLDILSSKCGLGGARFKFDRGTAKTATEVVSEHGELFQTKKRHEIILRSALKELCRIILRLGNSAMGAGLNEDVEISIDFDDSIIEDKAADFNRDKQLLDAGIMNDWEFRAKWMNEDPETAKRSLPGMEELTTEPQTEIGALKPNTTQSLETAEDVAGKSLNGAQTQSLINIIAQLQAGNLTEGQAANMISIAIGVTKEEAIRIIRGE